jgi:hypothetical protein
MTQDELTKFRIAFERFDERCGLPTDGRRRIAFERFLNEQFRINCNPADEIARLAATFDKYRFSGAELDTLRGLMQPGERLISVSPRRVISDRREIPRSECRPPRMAYETTAAHEALLAVSCPSESVLAELDAMHTSELATLEAARRDEQRRQINSEIAERQMADARQRAIEAQENVVLEIVERARLRRAN